MSSTRAPVREGHDVYETPEWAVRALLPHLPPAYLAYRILEPASGSGRIIRVLRSHYPESKIQAVEIRPECEAQTREAGADGHTVLDFLTGYPIPIYDLVITNPPYNKAMEFVQQSLRCVGFGGHVYMLLRLAFLESQKRADWLRENTPSIYVLPVRPSFVGGATDSSAYAWFSWRKGNSLGATVEILKDVR